jgi:hypothetical protein
LQDDLLRRQTQHDGIHHFESGGGIDPDVLKQSATVLG